jgi:hypothetical protein
VTQDGPIPQFRPYSLTPGQRLKVEVVQPDGGRALVAGKLDKVRDVAGGKALQSEDLDA